jgi:hypothetical protein
VEDGDENEMVRQQQHRQYGKLKGAVLIVFKIIFILTFAVNAEDWAF